MIEFKVVLYFHLVTYKVVVSLIKFVSSSYGSLAYWGRQIKVKKGCTFFILKCLIFASPDFYRTPLLINTIKTKDKIREDIINLEQLKVFNILLR